MGLDMYLSANKHIAKTKWEGNGNSSIYPQFEEVIKAADLTGVDNDIYGATIKVNVAYWRKANQIHKWFVDNIQEGEDNCRSYYVSKEKLSELLALAKRAYLEKNPNLLPPSDGFFFGGTQIDEWYWNDLDMTIQQLERVLSLPNLDELDLEYQASW